MNKTEIGWRYVKDWGQPTQAPFLHVWYDKYREDFTSKYYADIPLEKLISTNDSRYLYVNEISVLLPPKKLKYPWYPMEDLDRNCAVRIVVMDKNGRIERTLAWDTHKTTDEKYGRIAWCAEDNLMDTLYE